MTDLHLPPDLDDEALDSKLEGHIQWELDRCKGFWAPIAHLSDDWISRIASLLWLEEGVSAARLQCLVISDLVFLNAIPGCRVAPENRPVLGERSLDLASRHILPILILNEMFDEPICAALERDGLAWPSDDLLSPDAIAAWQELVASVSDGDLPADVPLAHILSHISNRRPELRLIIAWVLEFVPVYLERVPASVIPDFIEGFVRATARGPRLRHIALHALLQAERDIGRHNAPLAPLPRMPGHGDFNGQADLVIDDASSLHLLVEEGSSTIIGPEGGMPVIDWVRQKLAASGDDRDDLCRTWLNHFIDSICLRRWDQAPIEEPVTYWVAILHFMLARHSGEEPGSIKGPPTGIPSGRPSIWQGPPSMKTA